MNQGDLSNLVALGEGFTTEFKRSGTSGLGREICAFANATGGTILLGVTDDGEVCGVANHNRLKSEAQSIARSADPPIAVEIKSAGKVLCVRVPAQQSKPYSFGGKFFIREGSSSQQMSREEIREFFYKEGLIHFDATACEKFSLEADLDEKNWDLFRNRAKNPHRHGTWDSPWKLALDRRRRAHEPCRGLAAGKGHPQVQRQCRRRLRSLHGHRQGANP